MADVRFGGMLPLLGLAVPVIGALASLYLMTNTAYTKAVALEARVTALESTSAQTRLDVTVMHSDMTEIDTQLRASIDDSNKGLAWQLRVDSVLWERAFDGKSHLPIDNAVYPNIADGKSR